jgi:hypothetical protein
VPPRGYRKRRLKWTREDVVKKIKEWKTIYGDIPSAVDWNASDTRRASEHHAGLAAHWLERLRRFESGEWPWTGTVYKLFGGWNNAIEEAGFDPRPAVRPGYESGPLIRNVPKAFKELEIALQAAQKAEDPKIMKEQMYEVAAKALAIAETVPFS